MEIIDYWVSNKKPLLKPIPKISAIYQIISPSGKTYFGQTKNLQKRFSDYNKLNCEKQAKLYNSLKKYSVDKHQFFFLPIYICGLDKAEELLVAYFKTTDRKIGLNIRGGGSNTACYVPNSTKRKISRSKKGKSARSNNPKYLSDSHKKNIGIGVKISLRYKLGIASRDVSGDKNPFYGKKHTEETKKRLSEKRKGTLSYGKNPSAKLVVDTKTGEIFECGKQVAEMIGVKEGTFTSWLSGQRPNKSTYQYL